MHLDILQKPVGMLDILVYLRTRGKSMVTTILGETGVNKETFYSGIYRLQSLALVYRSEDTGFPTQVYYGLTRDGERLAASLIPVDEILTSTWQGLQSELARLEGSQTEDALPRRVELLRTLSAGEYDVGRWDEAEKHAAALADLAATMHDARLEAEARVAYGRVLQKRDRHEEAARELSRGLEQAESVEAWDLASEASYLIGSDLERQGLWVEAGERFTRSAERADRVGDAIRRSRAREAQGRILSRRDRHQEALLLLRAVVTEYQQLGAEDELPRAYISLGSTANALKLPEAGDWFEKGVEAARRIGNLRMEAYGLNSTAGKWVEHRQFTKSEKSLERAAQVFKDLGERSGLGLVELNFGNLRFAQGRLQEADASYGRALSMAQETGNRLREAMVLHKRGRLKVRGGLPGEARTLYQEARRIFTDLGSVERAAACDRDLESLTES